MIRAALYSSRIIWGGGGGMSAVVGATVLIQKEVTGVIELHHEDTLITILFTFCNKVDEDGGAENPSILQEDLSDNSTSCDGTPSGTSTETEQLTTVTTIPGIILKHRDQIILAIEESCSYTDCYCLMQLVYHWIINIKILNISYTMIIDIRNITTDDSSTFSIAGIIIL